MGLGKKENSKLTEMAHSHLLVLVWPSQSTLCKSKLMLRIEIWA